MIPALGESNAGETDNKRTLKQMEEFYMVRIVIRKTVTGRVALAGHLGCRQRGLAVWLV